MAKNTNTLSSIVRLIDTADNGKVAYLKAALATAAGLKGLEYGELKAVVQEAHDSRRANSPTSVKTLTNDLISARQLVIKFEGVEAAARAIDERNGKAARASYSPQYLQQELAPIEVKVAKVKEVKVSGKLAAAVAKGIITEAQARQIAAL